MQRPLVMPAWFLFASVAVAQVDKQALVGVVVDGTGAPVPGATVEVFECLGRDFSCFDLALRYEWTPVATTPVDKAGRFGLQVPAGASLRVQVRHESFACWRVDDFVLDRELRVQLQPACTLRGRLVDAVTGKGVPGAVRCLRDGVTNHYAGHTEAFRGRTDADGAFELTQLPPGPFTCMVEPDSHEIPAWWQGELVAAAPCEHRFELAAGREVRGSVRDATTGEPIAGATIGEGWFCARPLRSGADGTFVVRGIGSEATELACIADGYVRELRDLPARDAGAVPPAAVDFALARGWMLRGRIVDARGAGVAGVYVAAANAEPMRSWLATRSGADGSFALRGLPPQPGSVVVRAAGYAFAFYRAPEPDGDGRIDVGDLPLQPAHLLRAAVRDADGKPIAGARMRLFGINADAERCTGRPLIGLSGPMRELSDHFAYSNADGTVCFGAVAAGNYLLGFDADPQPMVPDDAIKVEVTAAGAPKDLTVTRGR